MGAVLWRWLLGVKVHEAVAAGDGDDGGCSVPELGGASCVRCVQYSTDMQYCHALHTVHCAALGTNLRPTLLYYKKAVYH